jgi:hypothetical protein
MIFTWILYLFALIIKAIAAILPVWSLWPASLLDGINYFFQNLASFNFIFPIDALFSVIIFLIQFEALYFTAKLIMKVFNFFRGAGSGVDI